MTMLEHKHQLTLIDLNPKYPYNEEVYDDEEDLISKLLFQCMCDRCNEKITYIHRYYYQCDQCNISLHKLCGELPITLEHASHIAHNLTLFQNRSQAKCYLCQSTHWYKQLCYHCSQCSFNICLDCGTNRVQYHTIYHPSHKHPLIPTNRPILTECDACGMEHKGVFYQCTTCFRAFIHNDCVFRSKRLLIQDGTCNKFSHPHALILTYSFSKIDQEAKNFPTCRICDNSFSKYESFWVYKCEKCRYYTHLHCAYLKDAPSESSDSDESDSGITYKYDRLAYHLPPSDQAYNIIKDMFKETNKEIMDYHRHPLTVAKSLRDDIVRAQMDDNDNLCNACIRPIMEDTTFYKCSDRCNFVLHDRCTRLPDTISRYYGGHPDTLSLRPRTPVLFRIRPGSGSGSDIWSFLPQFDAIKLEMDFVTIVIHLVCCLDVCCALTPEKFKHKFHPYHLLTRVKRRSTDKNYCRMCLHRFAVEDTETSVSCSDCNFHLHLDCAFSLTETIRVKYDKHIMNLSYGPVENYDGDYFCEVCEEELNPNGCFYHCQQCVQSVHLACAPSRPTLNKAYFDALSVEIRSSGVDNLKSEFVCFQREAKHVAPTYFHHPGSS